MSVQITEAFVQKYSSNMMLRAQQKGSRLRNAVTVEQGVGKSYSFDYVGAVAAQLGEAGDAPDIAGDAEILLQQLGPGDDLAQDGARAHQRHKLFLLMLFSRFFCCLSDVCFAVLLQCFVVLCVFVTCCLLALFLSLLLILLSLCFLCVFMCLFS